MQFFRTKIVDPLLAFIHDSRAVGITLLACTFLSLLLSNISSISEAYRYIFNFSFDGTTEHHWHLGFLSLPNSPLLIINDLLMAVFFFLAGMEIKRELLQGELSSIQKSLLPVIAAVGGMLIPAIFFVLFNKSTENIKGWAIPTATDIAFTLGVASLLGKRVPIALKIFLTALAIIDDLGAIVVIALFYGGAIKLLYALGCVIMVITLFILNKYKIKFGAWHFVCGILLWYCMFNSGIHATVAGVLFALFIPVEYLKKIELKIHLPVYFIIIPVFALANTAIVFPQNSLTALTGTLSWAILAGLCVGKPLGICGASYLMIKKKWCVLPDGVTWQQIIGAGLLAGIGFTMSIFISTLAFNDAMQQDIAKISVLLASFISMTAGLLWLRYSKPNSTA